MWSYNNSVVEVHEHTLCGGPTSDSDSTRVICTPRAAERAEGVRGKAFTRAKHAKN